MRDHDGAPVAARDEAVAATRAVADAGVRATCPDELRWHRAETERLRVLVDFLTRPIHAPGGAESDSDVITAYNLAVEAALNGIRRASAVRPTSPAL